MKSVDPDPYLDMDERRSPGRKQADSKHRTKQRTQRQGSWYDRGEDLTRNTLLYLPGLLLM